MLCNASDAISAPIFLCYEKKHFSFFLHVQKKSKDHTNFRGQRKATYSDSVENFNLLPVQIAVYDFMRKLPKNFLFLEKVL
jgi:hypothetical protein